MPAQRPEIRKIKKTRWVEAYAKTLNIASACQAAGVARSTYWRWCKSDPSFASAVIEVEQSLVDEVEGKLVEMARAGNLQAIKFLLKAKGADRGYMPKMQITQSERLERIDTRRLEVIFADPEKAEAIDSIATRMLSDSSELNDEDKEEVQGAETL
jgi:hypothetical protein